jgi:hypothetical protein
MDHRLTRLGREVRLTTMSCEYVQKGRILDISQLRVRDVDVFLGMLNFVVARFRLLRHIGPGLSNQVGSACAVGASIEPRQAIRYSVARA